MASPGAVVTGQWQDEQRTKFGAQDLQYVDYFDFKDKLGLLTANATTPYSMAFPNLKRRVRLCSSFRKARLLVAYSTSGSVLLPIPERWVRTSRRVANLIVGPNDPDMKPEGYFVFRSPTNNIWSGQRGLSANLDEAKATLGKMRNLSL